MLEQLHKITLFFLWVEIDKKDTLDTNYAPGIGKKIPWTAINNYKKSEKKRVSHYSTLDVDIIWIQFKGFILGFQN